MTYEEQLQDPRWKKRRQEIIDMNWGYCTCCGTSKNIQVHHKRYFDGLMAWEYPNSLLTTLCANCHALEHNKVPERQPIKHIKDAIIEYITLLQKSLRNAP